MTSLCLERKNKATWLEMVSFADKQLARNNIKYWQQSLWANHDNNQPYLGYKDRTHREINKRSWTEWFFKDVKWQFKNDKRNYALAHHMLCFTCPLCHACMICNIFLLKLSEKRNRITKLTWIIFSWLHAAWSSNLPFHIWHWQWEACYSCFVCYPCLLWALCHLPSQCSPTFIASIILFSLHLSLICQSCWFVDKMVPGVCPHRVGAPKWCFSPALWACNMWHNCGHT